MNFSWGSNEKTQKQSLFVVRVVSLWFELRFFGCVRHQPFNRRHGDQSGGRAVSSLPRKIKPQALNFLLFRARHQ